MFGRVLDGWDIIGAMWKPGSPKPQPPRTDWNSPDYWEHFNDDYEARRPIELERMAQEMWADALGVEVATPTLPHAMTEVEMDWVLDRLNDLAHAQSIPDLSHARVISWAHGWNRNDAEAAQGGPRSGDHAASALGRAVAGEPDRDPI